MMILYRVPLSAKMFCFFPIMIVLFVVTFGMSMILMHLGVFVEDLSNVVNVGLRLYFICPVYFIRSPTGSRNRISRFC